VTNKGELIKALRLYGGKMLKTGLVPSLTDVKQFIQSYTDFLGESELRLYKAIPSKIYKLAPSKVINGKYIDSRIEVSI
jgi:hypothetical protein